VRAPAALPPLYAIVDPLDTGRDPVDLARDMLAGGAPLLQLRLKDAPPRMVWTVARRIVALAAAAGARVIVNDRPDIAAAAGADGVHLGQTDVPLAVAARLLPAPAWVGLSTHDTTQIAAATTLAPTYVAVGPVYHTASKRGAAPARGLDLIRQARRLTDRPLVAIGGITLRTAPEVRAAGADSVAMIGALIRTADVAATVREALAILR
jgi:thiamine-phosphate pyrophosphorylase